MISLGWVSYRQPDTAALEERDGHEERVAAILATIDAEEGLAERRRGRLRVAGVVVVGAALLGPILLASSRWVMLPVSTSTWPSSMVMANKSRARGAGGFCTSPLVSKLDA